MRRAIVAVAAALMVWQPVMAQEYDAPHVEMVDLGCITDTECEALERWLEQCGDEDICEEVESRITGGAALSGAYLEGVQ